MAIVFAAQSSASSLPSIVPNDFTHIYVADGFDDNDNIQITGAGSFPNSCYRYASTKVEVNNSDKIITLHTFAYKYETQCIQMVMPFYHPVDLGLLAAGDYSIVRGSDKKNIGRINVRPSKSSDADDYLYAPVTQSFFLATRRGQKVSLTGNFSISCMKIKEVKIDIQSDVILIQPIAEIDSSISCSPGNFPFRTNVDVSTVKSGRYLLHVRSMHTKALNSLVDIP